MWRKMNSDSGDRTIEFPQRGDQLFRSDLIDSENNSFLSYGMLANEARYADGYRCAALHLAAHVVSTNNGRDTLVLTSAPIILNRPLAATEKGHLKVHNIDFLWKDTRPVIVELGGRLSWDLSLGYIEATGEYIDQLSNIDPGSLSFRYATTKAGTRSLPINLQLLNIRNFAHKMERLSNFLSCVDDEATRLCDSLSVG